MDQIIDGNAETPRASEILINETWIMFRENMRMAAESHLYPSRVETNELRAQIEAEVREQIKADLLSEVGVGFYQTT